MRAITREWVSKAEADYNVVLLLLKSRQSFRVDPICFHSQQCVEKYLKGRLAEEQTYFPKTHDLLELLDLLKLIEPLWIGMSSRLSVLSKHAINPRYPGMNPTLMEMREAVATCRKMRDLARASIGV